MIYSFSFEATNGNNDKIRARLMAFATRLCC